jgi:RNA polymerase sigma factor (sigma-70 family)
MPDPLSQKVDLSSPGQERDGASFGNAASERARAVARLFEEHNRALISFLTLRLHSPQDAREVAQEAYVRLLELDRTGAVSFMRAYLFRIAANLAVDRIRRQIVRRTSAEEEKHLLDEVDEAAAPERQFIAREELREIGRRLDELPPKCKKAFVMHQMLERPVKEIAQEMKLTERMVRYYIVRGLAVCREVRGEGGKL